MLLLGKIAGTGHWLHERLKGLRGPIVDELHKVPFNVLRLIGREARNGVQAVNVSSPGGMLALWLNDFVRATVLA
jgi:hypothetical protein